MFLDRLCHELIGGYRRFSIGRRISSPNDARLINAGDSVQHLVEHPVHATRNQRCVVCTEKYNKAKKQHPYAKDIDLPKRSKKRSGAVPVKSSSVCLLVQITASNCIIHLLSFGVEVTLHKTSLPEQFV